MARKEASENGRHGGVLAALWLEELKWREREMAHQDVPEDGRRERAAFWLEKSLEE